MIWKICFFYLLMWENNILLFVFVINYTNQDWKAADTKQQYTKQTNFLAAKKQLYFIWKLYTILDIYI